MNTNDNSAKKNITSIVGSLILIAVCGVLAVVTGVFGNIMEITSVLFFDLETIFRVIIAVAFVIAISNIVLLVLKTLGDKGGRIGTLSSVISSLVKLG